MLFPATHACYGGDLGLGVNPKLLARIKASDLVLVVGGRLSEVPSQGLRAVQHPTPAQPWCMCMPMRMNWASSTPHTVHPRHAAGVCCGAERCAPTARPCPGRRTPRQPACRVPGLRTGAHPHPRQSANGPGDAAPQGSDARRHHFLQRRWQLCHLDSPILAFTHYASQLAPTSGSMGYGLPAVWAASACGPAQSDGLCGRRRLPHARPGVCDRRAVRPCPSSW